MILSIERSLEVTKKNQSLFGREYLYEFTGPNIDITDYDFVSLVSFYIECDEESSHNYVNLRSSIIDKSAANPNQVIFSFYRQEKTSVLFETPTRKIEYKIQCHSLDQSVFTISFSKQVKKIKICLRVEFSKCHTDSVKL